MKPRLLFLLTWLGVGVSWWLWKFQPAAPLPDEENQGFASTPAPIELAQPPEDEPFSAQASLIESATHTDRPYWTEGTHSYLLLKFVATGEYSEILRPDGTQVKTLTGLTVNAFGEVVAIPVAYALLTPDGQAYSLSIFAYGQPIPAQDLPELQAQFPRGRLFSATVFDFVTADRVDWEYCPDHPFPGQPICTLAQQQADAHLDQEFRLLKGTARDLPAGWVLLGWGLEPYTPENANLWQVALPEEQP